MGSITRGFANNITTSGNFQGSGLTGSVATSLLSGTIADGNLSNVVPKLLQDTTISSDTQINTSSSILTGSGYNNIELQFDNIIPTTNADEIVMYLSTDNGSTFHNFYNGRIYINLSSASSGAEQQTAGYIRTQTNPGNDANEGISGRLFIHGAAKNGGFKHITYHITGREDNGVYSWVGGATVQGNSAPINYIRLAPVSGGANTLASGQYRVIGY